MQFTTNSSNSDFFIPNLNNKSEDYFRKRRILGIKSFFVVATLILIGIFILSSAFQKNGLIKIQILGTNLNDRLQKSSNLKEVVEKALVGTKGTYAVYIKNFKTNEEYKSRENDTFEPASLYKLWVMATTYQQIKEGALKEDEMLSQSIPTLNQEFGIDPSLAELTEGSIEMTVTEALTQMITISHNYAALLLAEKVKNSVVKDYIQNNGFSNSSLGEPPKTTASDIALFFEKLYKGKIVDKEYSDKMIELLKKQQLKNGLPRFLPEGTIIAHKTGEIDWYKHDAGIVFSPAGDYLIVILSESDSPPGAQERIADVSKAVYDYFTSR